MNWYLLRSDGNLKKICKFDLVKIALLHVCSPVNLLHIFRTAFPKNISGWLFLSNFSQYAEFTSQTSKHENKMGHQLEMDLKDLIPFKNKRFKFACVFKLTFFIPLKEVVFQYRTYSLHIVTIIIFIITNVIIIAIIIITVTFLNELINRLFLYGLMIPHAFMKIVFHPPFPLSNKIDRTFLGVFFDNFSDISIFFPLCVCVQDFNVWI